MPSLIPGYEYDIFISYRHNDNRSGWVREFVKNLEEELAATIKQPVSIYFDSNLHDGLLDTHNVDKSLEGKLKCLIFIPIISQTYCDPKSFAWQHEFCAFHKLAREDQFGRDIKLRNGNITSRLFPVKIHDLDDDDLEMLQEEIGGPLRAINFIYQEPGVNRPLRPGDEVFQNLNKTNYRNQVNKAANAIKEVIAGLRNPVGKPVSSATSNHVFSDKTGGQAKRKSIVVLPFQNMSPDAENEYFSDGMTEDIIAQLSKISGLKVISRTTAMQYRKAEKHLREISDELGISHALEGSVRKSGNRIRIVAQLINAETDEQLWAETFDREIDDIFAIQTEVAEGIAGVLQARLSPAEKSMIAKRPTKNLDAYHQLLIGRHYHYKTTSDGFAKAITCFQRAIELDPAFADAYAWLASTKYHKGVGYYGVRPHEVVPEVLDLLAKALDLDPTNAEAYQVRALIRDWYSFEWEAAEQDHKRALELNPNNPVAHIYFAFHLIGRGRLGDALAARERAHELDPGSWFIRGEGIFVQRFARRFDDALAESRSLCELDAGNPGSWFVRGVTSSHLDLRDEALESFGKAVQLDDMTFLKIMLAYGLAGAGRAAEAREVLAKIFKRGKAEYVWPMGLALVYMKLGETDRALHYLQQSYDDRVGWMSFLAFDPLFDPLRTHPRFQALIRKISPREAIEVHQELLKKYPPEVSSSPSKKRIVVLPFENISSDKENEYFSDGLTEEIIADLSNVKELGVISRSSAMTFKGTKKKIREIAQEVGVQYVLEGSVRKEGSNLRITAQLIDGMSDAHLWAEKYNGTIKDVFRIQESVSRSIVKALELKLSKDENAKIVHRPVEDPQAYDLCLKAQYEFYRFREDALLRAMQYLETAVKIVGPNAHIYRNMGFIYCNLFNIASTVEEVYLQKAEDLANQIFALESDAGEGHSLLGFIGAFKGSKIKMVRHLERAYLENPTDSNTLVILSLGYFLCGQADPAQKILDELKAIDPFNPVYHVIMALVSCTRGKLDLALACSRTAYENHPDVPGSKLYYAFFLACNGCREESYAVFDQLIADQSGTIVATLGSFLKYSLQGEKTKALDCLSADGKTKLKRDVEWSWLIADGYALLGKKEEALKWLESIIRLDFINYPLICQHDIFLKSIRGEAQFIKLMERVKVRWENFHSCEVPQAS